MTVDRHGMSHKPAGLPQRVAGTYDGRASVNTDGDLDEWAAPYDPNDGIDDYFALPPKPKDDYQKRLEKINQLAGMVISNKLPKWEHGEALYQQIRDQFNGRTSLPEVPEQYRDRFTPFDYNERPLRVTATWSGTVYAEYMDLTKPYKIHREQLDTWPAGMEPGMQLLYDGRVWRIGKLPDGVLEEVHALRANQERVEHKEQELNQRLAQLDKQPATPQVESSRHQVMEQMRELELERIRMRRRQQRLQTWVALFQIFARLFRLR